MPTRRKVLLVDDSELTLQITSSVLAADYDVRTTTEVHDLRGLLGEWAPDIILTDVNMPGTSGPELCRVLKSSYETAHVPVVLFSSLPSEELEVLARECEADAYLTKGGLAELPAALAHLITTTVF